MYRPAGAHRSSSSSSAPQYAHAPSASGYGAPSSRPAYYGAPAAYGKPVAYAAHVPAARGAAPHVMQRSALPAYRPSVPSTTVAAAGRRRRDPPSSSGTGAGAVVITCGDGASLPLVATCLDEHMLPLDEQLLHDGRCELSPTARCVAIALRPAGEAASGSFPLLAREGGSFAPAYLVSRASLRAVADDSAGAGADPDGAATLPGIVFYAMPRWE